MKLNDNLKLLAGNTAALSLLQAMNYLAPLLLIPYLTRVLGLQVYGVVAFGLAVVQIACMLTDYGFNFSATYLIAREKGDKVAISNIVSSVMICKFGLFVVSMLLLLVFIFFNDKYHEYQLFFLLLGLSVFGQTFQPLWFFQGVEKMFYITVYSSLSRLLHLGAVFVLVSSVNDYWWVAISNGVSHIVAALVGVYFMIRMGYSFPYPGYQKIKTVFNASTPYFFGRAAVSAYTAGGTVFLGLASTPIQAALYAAAEQLYRGVVTMIGPLHQALYPYMTRTQDVKLFKKILFISSFIATIGLVVGIWIGPWVVRIIYGPEFAGAYPVLVVFMVVFTLVIPSGLLGYPFLGALGNANAANKSVIFGGVVQVLLLAFFYINNWILATETVFTVLIVEIGVLTYRAIASYKLVQELSQRESS